MKKTGIIGAMEKEVSAIRNVMHITETKTFAGMNFASGTLGGKEAVVVQCGIGKVNAGVCAQLLISLFGVDQIINTGVAGSLDNEINIADIVVSTDAVQHDYDVSVLGFDDSEMLDYLDCALTSIRQHKHELGEQAARILVMRMREKEQKAKKNPLMNISLKPELVKRNSCAPCKNKKTE